MLDFLVNNIFYLYLVWAAGWLVATMIQRRRSRRLAMAEGTNEGFFNQMGSVMLFAGVGTFLGMGPAILATFIFVARTVNGNG